MNGDDVFVTSFAAAILNFLLPFTLGSVHNRALEFLDPEIGIALESRSWVSSLTGNDTAPCAVVVKTQ
jgi:hypothetical protein